MMSRIRNILLALLPAWAFLATAISGQSPATGLRTCDTIRADIKQTFLRTYQTSLPDSLLQELLPMWIHLGLPKSCQDKAAPGFQTFNPSSTQDAGGPLGTLGNTGAIYTTSRRTRKRRGAGLGDVTADTEASLVRHKRFIGGMGLGAPRGGPPKKEVSAADKMMSMLMMMSRIQRSRHTSDIRNANRPGYYGDRVSFGGGMFGDQYYGKRKKRSAEVSNHIEASGTDAATTGSLGEGVRGKSGGEGNSRVKRFFMSEPGDAPMGFGGLRMGMGGMNPIMRMMMGTDPNTGRPMKFGGDAMKDMMRNSYINTLPAHARPPPGKEPGDFIKAMAPVWYMSRMRHGMSPAPRYNSYLDNYVPPRTSGFVQRQNHDGTFGDKFPRFGKRKKRSSDDDQDNNSGGNTDMVTFGDLTVPIEFFKPPERDPIDPPPVPPVPMTQRPVFVPAFRPILPPRPLPPAVRRLFRLPMRRPVPLATPRRPFVPPPPRTPILLPVVSRAAPGPRYPPPRPAAVPRYPPPRPAAVPRSPLPRPVPVPRYPVPLARNPAFAPPPPRAAMPPTRPFYGRKKRDTEASNNDVTTDDRHRRFRRSDNNDKKDTKAPRSPSISSLLMPFLFPSPAPTPWAPPFSSPLLPASPLPGKMRVGYTPMGGAIYGDRLPWRAPLARPWMASPVAPAALKLPVVPPARPPVLLPTRLPVVPPARPPVVPPARPPVVPPARLPVVPPARPPVVPPARLPVVPPARPPVVPPARLPVVPPARLPMVPPARPLVVPPARPPVVPPARPPVVPPARLPPPPATIPVVPPPAVAPPPPARVAPPPPVPAPLLPLAQPLRALPALIPRLTPPLAPGPNPYSILAPMRPLAPVRSPAALVPAPIPAAVPAPIPARVPPPLARVPPPPARVPPPPAGAPRPLPPARVPPPPAGAPRPLPPAAPVPFPSGFFYNPNNMIIPPPAPSLPRRPPPPVARPLPLPARPLPPAVLPASVPQSAYAPIPVYQPAAPLSHAAPAIFSPLKPTPPPSPFII